jgi:hypothetical protein
MKILKFNENNNDDDSYKKFVKITFEGELEVPFEDIKRTEAYQNAFYKKYDNPLFYGVEGYLEQNTDNINYNYRLVDGNGNPIDDEEEFDKKVELYNAGKKYNI